MLAVPAVTRTPPLVSVSVWPDGIARSAVPVNFTVFKVAAQDLETNRLRILSDTSLDESPTVAPNGAMLIYATRQQGRGVLMLASTNGRVRLPLPTAQGEVREPSWSPYLN